MEIRAILGDFVVTVFHPLAFFLELLLRVLFILESSEWSRVICDHISGMTDDYAMKTYERLFVPRASSVFQKNVSSFRASCYP